MFSCILRANINIIFRRFSQEVKSTSILSCDHLSGVDRGIIIVGFNHHQARNALGRDFTSSLSKTLTGISNDPEARVVIFRSTVPKVFCAGADLKERRSMSEAEVKVFVNQLRNLMLNIENIPVPTIAAIDGAALGGGLELALACDLRVAVESARLGLVETRLAILPGAGGTQRLPRLIGVSLAKELIFTARIVSGNEAEKLGMVNHCVSDNNKGDSAFEKSLSIAREISANGPLAVRLAKLAINKGQEVDINQGCTIEELCYAQVIPTKDRLEGLVAFTEKRKPIYKGE